MVSILASAEFFDAWKYVPILIIGVMFQHISTLVGGIFMAERKSKYFFYSSIWGAGTSVVLTLLLIKICGLYGVCIAVALSFMCMAVVRIMFAWKHINMLKKNYYIATFIILIFQSILYILNLGLMIDLFALLVSCALLMIINRSSVATIAEKVRLIIQSNNNNNK